MSRPEPPPAPAPDVPPAPAARASGLRPRADLPAWRWIPRASRVFVNRNLRMETVGAIGFDLDHTLAHYDPEQVERLAFTATARKLVEGGYFREDILQLEYQADRVIRGLVVDRRRGNLLKMDYFNYVRRAWHGERALGSEERKRTYRRRRVRLSAQTYVSADTMFHLPEAYLYQLLVGHLDRQRNERIRSYEELYTQVRRHIDQAHADRTIKNVIMAHRDLYLRRDPQLATVMNKLRRSGKKLFLLTNSELYYTDALLSHLLGDGTGGRPRWQSYFDLIVVEARKPGYFLAGRDESGLQRLPGGPDDPPVFAGGNAYSLQRELGFWNDQILYFGDHTYGDILRSKKSLSWRTAMIIPEIAREMSITESLKPELEQFAESSRQRSTLEMQLVMMEDEEAQLQREGEAGAPRSRLAALERERAALTARLRALEAEEHGLEERCDAAYNLRWGPLFREGREMSRFSHQVKDFACIYMGQVSNLLQYPANHYFQSAENLMPHEL